jgi:hypothetical protein
LGVSRWSDGGPLSCAEVIGGSDMWYRYVDHGSWLLVQLEIRVVLASNGGGEDGRGGDGGSRSGQYAGSESVSLPSWSSLALRMSKIRRCPGSANCMGRVVWLGSGWWVQLLSSSISSLSLSGISGGIEGSVSLSVSLRRPLLWSLSSSPV